MAGRVEEPCDAGTKTAKVEGRAQRDTPAAFLEPLAVEEDHGEVLRHLRRIDDPDRERLGSGWPDGTADGLDHRAETPGKGGVRIRQPGNGRGTVEQHGLRFAARGIAVQLADLRPVL